MKSKSQNKAASRIVEAGASAHLTEMTNEVLPFCLVVTSNFAKHKRGDFISDSSEISGILGTSFEAMTVKVKRGIKNA